MRLLILVVLAGDVCLGLAILLYRIPAAEFGVIWYALLSMAIVFAGFCAASLYLLSSHRDTVANVWTGIIATFSALLVFDLLAGLFLIHPVTPLLIRDDVTHHRLAANSTTTRITPDFSIEVTTNSLGIRDEEVDTEKGADEYRILMLGDSFTVGQGVRADQTFSALLEKQLELLDGGRPKVINAGVDSFTPLLSYLFFRDELLSLQPDLVVLNLDMSDLHQETAYRRIAIRNSSGEVVAVPASDKLWIGDLIRRWARDHLFLGRWLIFHLDQWLNPEDQSVSAAVERASHQLLQHTLKGDVEDRSAEWAAVFRSIPRLRALCGQNGIRFLLTVYPWGHQVDASEWVEGRKLFMLENDEISDRSLRTIERFAMEADMEFFNAFPAFRERREEGPIYFEHDMHWQPIGHVIMADALEPKIRAMMAESQTHIGLD